MNKSQTKMSQADALAMITAAAPNAVTVRDLMAAFECSDSVVQKKLALLQKRGLVDFHEGPMRVRQYVLGDGRGKIRAKPAPKEDAPVVVPGPLVSPFKTNIWTPPLKGYSASFKAAESLAMLVRR